MPQSKWHSLNHVLQVESPKTFLVLIEGDANLLSAHTTQFYYCFDQPFIISYEANLFIVVCLLGEYLIISIFLQVIFNIRSFQHLKYFNSVYYMFIILYYPKFVPMSILFLNFYFYFQFIIRIIIFLSSFFFPTRQRNRLKLRY